eukprot:6456486-Pyramimonas_sp.AAC.1
MIRHTHWPTVGRGAGRGALATEASNRLEAGRAQTRHCTARLPPLASSRPRGGRMNPYLRGQQ